MVHALKTAPNYFELSAAGVKNFEVRKHDRPYQVGDYIILNEWENGCYTGRYIVCYITYILDNEEYCKDGYVILGFE